MPKILLPKGGSILQAYNVIAWSHLNLKKINPLKLRPFLGYRPVEIISKTLKHTTQRDKMILHCPMQKHMKPNFLYLTPNDAMKWYHQTVFMQISKTLKTAWYAVMSFMVAQQDALIYSDTRKEEIDTTILIEIFAGIMGFQLYWHVTTLKNKSPRK